MAYKNPLAHREERAAYSRAYNAVHREEQAAYRAAHRAEHRKERAAYQRMYNATHPEKLLAYRESHRRELATKSRAYKKEHKEEIATYRAAHREESRIYAHDYYATHLQEYAEQVRRRNAFKSGAIIGLINFEAIKVRDRMRCCICGKRVNERLKHPHPYSLSFDHSHPLSLHGPHSQENQRVAHLRCNIRRGAGRLPVQMVLV